MASSGHPVPGQVGVGVAAIITNAEGKILVGKRKGGFGNGKWQIPGGHLEFREDVLVCAAREAEEETGLRTRGVRVKNVTNSVFEEGNKHYITIFVECEMLDPSQEPQTTEPDKCYGWEWQPWRFLVDIKNKGRETGEALFMPLEQLLSQPELTPVQV